jgi:hypothetical protein
VRAYDRRSAGLLSPSGDDGPANGEGSGESAK